MNPLITSTTAMAMPAMAPLDRFSEDTADKTELVPAAFELAVEDVAKLVE